MQVPHKLVAVIIGVAVLLIAGFGRLNTIERWLLIALEFIFIAFYVYSVSSSFSVVGQRLRIVRFWHARELSLNSVTELRQHPRKGLLLRDANGLLLRIPKEIDEFPTLVSDVVEQLSDRKVPVKHQTFLGMWQ